MNIHEEAILASHGYSKLISLLEDYGISQEQLLRESSLNIGPADINIFNGLNAVIVLETASKLTNDHHIALRLGQLIGIESYNTFGFALMSCANLRESSDLLVRYGRVFFKPSWKSESSKGGLLLWPDFTNIGTLSHQRLITELTFSQLIRIANSLCLGRLDGAEIQFSFPMPAEANIYKKIFGAKITFDAERSQIYIPDTILDTPVKTANISDHVVFLQQCEEILNSLAGGNKIITEVRRLLLQSAGKFLDITGVANRLNMSERTLRRKLNAESLNFRIIADEVKDRLARDYLTKTTLTVADIAHLLSYSETVNFRRAFVRWNGITPNKYRLKHTNLT